MSHRARHNRCESYTRTASDSTCAASGLGAHPPCAAFNLYAPPRCLRCVCVYTRPSRVGGRTQSRSAFDADGAYPRPDSTYARRAPAGCGLAPHSMSKPLRVARAEFARSRSRPGARTVYAPELRWRADAFAYPGPDSTCAAPQPMSKHARGGDFSRTGASAPPFARLAPAPVSRNVAPRSCFGRRSCCARHPEPRAQTGLRSRGRHACAARGSYATGVCGKRTARGGGRGTSGEARPSCVADGLGCAHSSRTRARARARFPSRAATGLAQSASGSCAGGKRERRGFAVSGRREAGGGRREARPPARTTLAHARPRRSRVSCGTARACRDLGAASRRAKSRCRDVPGGATRRCPAARPTRILHASAASPNGAESAGRAGQAEDLRAAGLDSPSDVGRAR
ncbi:hypothetical protein B0H15DRAFT_537589 [Mycena belliarum]|uniref:Uncharacterized protein n=1 Tax=Mycena belliarum TaxID=1033014 RepID=A0AAD6XPD5_9AGAR|nr:hypothetical protein B0H15DRAFT_537589 [Mycena belliae]